MSASSRLRAIGYDRRRTFKDLCDLTYAEFLQWGYEPFSVSIFNHILTETEFVAADFTDYREAKEKGLLAAYEKIEQAFLSLYSRLGEGGVVQVPPAYLKPMGQARPLDPGSRHFKRIVTASRRETRFMDLYFPAHRLRVRGGWDLTDHFLVEAGADREPILERAVFWRNRDSQIRGVLIQNPCR